MTGYAKPMNDQLTRMVRWGIRSLCLTWGAIHGLLLCLLVFESITATRLVVALLTLAVDAGIVWLLTDLQRGRRTRSPTLHVASSTDLRDAIANLDLPLLPTRPGWAPQTIPIPPAHQNQVEVDTLLPSEQKGAAESIAEMESKPTVSAPEARFGIGVIGAATARQEAIETARSLPALATTFCDGAISETPDVLLHRACAVILRGPGREITVRHLLARVRGAVEDDERLPRSIVTRLHRVDTDPEYLPLNLGSVAGIRIRKLRQREGWSLTRLEAICGLSGWQTVDHVEALLEWGYGIRYQDLEAIADELCEAPSLLFPEVFGCLDRFECPICVSAEDEAAWDLCGDQIDDILASLSEREQQLIRRHVMSGEVQGAVADEWDGLSSRARQTLTKALRKLRHPGYRRKLRDYLEADCYAGERDNEGWTTRGEWAVLVS